MRSTKPTFCRLGIHIFFIVLYRKLYEAMELFPDQKCCGSLRGEVETLTEF